MNAPLYFTGLSTEGTPLLGGIFQMQDRHGFPLDACMDEAKRHGCAVDWMEALADCWLNDCLKFDSFAQQAMSCTGNASMLWLFQASGAALIRRFPKIETQPKPVDVICRYILAKKRMRAIR